MPTRTWQLSLDGKPYQIILKHGAFSGKREIWVNGESVMKARITIDGGSEHHFTVGTHPAEIGIVANLTWKYEFYLLVDGQLQFALEEKKPIIGKRTKAKLDERNKWQNMGQTFGLEYHPLEVKSFIYQPRLLGFYRNFLVQIQPGFMRAGEAYVPGVQVLIRHFELDEEKIKTIKKEKQIEAFLRETKFPQGLEIYRSATSFFIRILNKKGAQKLEETIAQFLALIPQFIHPLSPEKCEGAMCKQRVGQDLRLTIINNAPLLMCDSCIGEIEGLAKQTEEAYQQAPSHLLKGLLYGAGGALAGAMIWALVMIFLDSIGAVFAAVILLFVVRLMDKAGTKRTITSALLAALLSLGGAVVGTYFGILGILLKEGKLVITLDRLLRIAIQMFSEPELLWQPIFFALIGIIPYTFLFWSASRKGLKRFFAPEVEVITAFRQLPFKPG